MKTKLLAISMGLFISLLSQTSLACNEETFRGDLDIARSLEAADLRCNYNGVISEGHMTVLVPRCREGHPVVTLTAFKSELTVTDINVKVLRGYKSYKHRYLIDTLQADFPISCEIVK